MEGTSPTEWLSARAASTSRRSPTDPASTGPPGLSRAKDAQHSAACQQVSDGAAMPAQAPPP